ncbi:alpha/beta hydrolase [Streptomyces sp. NPDC004542]|uniref:alpha/beta fold hydrolase n=1 Tax=Streptomyces sp. NPDC004542 TaxID=3154281 RepID=UPI0033B6FF01
MGLAVERTGSRGPLLLLIHGLGANLAVWDPFLAAARWPGRTLAVDLRGHGESPKDGPFGIGTMAADVAELLVDEPDVAVVGHSLGGAVGVLLASGLFGVRPGRLAVFGVKADWDPELVRRLHGAAGAPVRYFPTAAEAGSRALAVAGLRGLVGADARVAVRGTGTGPKGWHAVTAPAANLVAGQNVTAVARELTCPFAVARGAADDMVTAEEAAALGPQPLTVEGAGHHPHVSRPAGLWRCLEGFLLGRPAGGRPPR